MSSNYDFSYEWDQRYCYPHSKVLINKLDIKNEEKLRITSVKLMPFIPSEKEMAGRKFHKYAGEYSF